MSIWDMTEEQLLQEIARRCAEREIWWVHIDTPYRNRRKQNLTGFPDLFLCGQKGTAFRELKKQNGRISSAAQTSWKYRLRAAGQDWAMWRPSDLESGLIDEALDKLAT